MKRETNPKPCQLAHQHDLGQDTHVRSYITKPYTLRPETRVHFFFFFFCFFFFCNLPVPTRRKAPRDHQSLDCLPACLSDQLTNRGDRCLLKKLRRRGTGFVQAQSSLLVCYNDSHYFFFFSFSTINGELCKQTARRLALKFLAEEKSE